MIVQIYLSIISSQLLTERYLPSLKLKLNFSPLYPSLSLSLKKNSEKIFYFVQIFFFPKKKNSKNSRIFFNETREIEFTFVLRLNRYTCKYPATDTFTFKIKNYIGENLEKPFPSILHSTRVTTVSISIVARCVNGREIFARVSTAVVLYLYARAREREI